MKFRKGEAVVMTARASALIPHGPRTGVIASEPRDSARVMVRRTGNKTAETWATKFWKHAKAIGDRPVCRCEKRGAGLGRLLCHEDN